MELLSIKKKYTKKENGKSSLNQHTPSAIMAQYELGEIIIMDSWVMEQRPILAYSNIK